MASRLAPRLALATAVAVGLYVPTFGLPVPGSCMRTGGVASAAPTPSPSCGGDLRECLRMAADQRQTTFGGRYVTAEDVARCMEAFNSCIHGGASTGGNPAPPVSTTAGRKPSTPAGGKTEGTMPQRFTVALNYDNYSFDCQTSGTAVTCTQQGAATMAELITDTGEIVGSLSGLTMTGTWTNHKENGSDCINVMDSSIPITFVFTTDGKVTIKLGAYEQRHTYRGGCASIINPNSDSLEATEWPSTWTR